MSEIAHSADAYLLGESMSRLPEGYLSRADTTVYLPRKKLIGTQHLGKRYIMCSPCISLISLRHNVSVASRLRNCGNAAKYMYGLHVKWKVSAPISSQKMRMGRIFSMTSAASFFFFFFQHYNQASSV